MRELNHRIETLSMRPYTKYHTPLRTPYGEKHIIGIVTLYLIRTDVKQVTQN